MASALGVPRSVREVASVIYRRALNEDLIRGRSIEGVSTAALYAACRQEGIPRSLDEVADVSRVPQKEIGRTYRYISQELGLELKPVDLKQFVPRFASALQLSEEVQSKATEIIDVSAEQGLLSGKSPTDSPRPPSTPPPSSVTRRRPSARSPTSRRSPRSPSATGIRSRSKRWDSARAAIESVDRRNSASDAPP